MNNDDPQVKKMQKELIAGAVALVLLTIIERAEQPLYGYQIAKQLERAQENSMAGKQSALYPVLRTMCANALLDSFVEPSVSGPPRRYYRITDTGRLVLTDWKLAWEKNKRFVDSVLSGLTSVHAEQPVSDDDAQEQSEQEQAS